MRRQCTREYKIEAVHKLIRSLLGYRPGTRVRVPVEQWIGISLDEAIRAKPSRVPWVTTVHPLLDVGLRRSDCIKVIQDAGLPVPKKSACYFCPMHSNDYWRDLRDNHPVEWRKAVAFDGKVRDQTRYGVDSPVFLHRSLVPLGEVDLSLPQRELFGEECEGMCGV